MREHNRVVHGEWWTYEGEFPLANTHRSWKGVEMGDLDVSDLRQLASQLADVSQRLEDAHEQVHGSGHASAE